MIKKNPFVKNRQGFTVENSKLTLLMGDENRPQIKRLTAVLEEYFPPAITLNTVSGEVFRRFPEPDLVILTDTLQYAVHTPVALRNHFPNARFLALFDRVEPEMERVLRCVGTLFLGSYESFYTFSQTIIETLVAAQCRLTQPII